MDHLTVLSPEAVALHIKGIAACLGHSTVEFTLPLNAAKCPQLPFAIVAGNQVVLQDGIQLPCSPLQVAMTSISPCSTALIRRSCRSWSTSSALKSGW